MSRGHFGYFDSRYEWDDILTAMEEAVDNKALVFKDENGTIVEKFPLSDKTISEFKVGIDLIKKTRSLLVCVDGLFSGDFGDKEFINRLNKENE